MAHLGDGEGNRRARRAGRLARVEMIVRLARWFLSADVLGLVLVSTALYALTDGITSSLRNTDTGPFFWICLLAVLIAYALSKRLSSGILASVWMIGLGILGIWILA